MPHALTHTHTHTHSHTLALAPVASRFTQSAGLARTKLGAAGAKLRRSKAQTAAAKQRRSQIRQFECVVHSTRSACSPCPPLLTTARVPSCDRLACRYDRPQKLVTVQLRRRTAPPFATLTEVKAIVKDVRSGGIMAASWIVSMCQLLPVLPTCRPSWSMARRTVSKQWARWTRNLAGLRTRWGHCIARYCPRPAWGPVKPTPCGVPPAARTTS